MTDAPERIWAQCTAGNNWDEPIASPRKVDHFHEYIRADLVPGWQPIETAPKDGTWFLGWSPRKAAEDQIDVWRWHDEPHCHEMTGWMNASDTCDFADDWPTHWMPLPTPPKGGE